MAKTNFTKVEGILDDGLRKMAVDHLLNLADAVQAGKESQGDSKKESILPIITALQRDLKFLQEEGQEPYELFNVSKKTVNNYLKNADALTSEQVEEIKDLQLKVRKFKKDFEKNSTKKSDTDLVESQRKRHKTKRFNINEKSLPLS